jgi:hypothetical protein
MQMAIILELERFDEGQYPNVLKGIAERIPAPALQFVFVDTIEQARDLKQRIAGGHSSRRAAFNLCDPCWSNQCFRGIHCASDRNSSNAAKTLRTVLFLKHSQLDPAQRHPRFI